MESLYVVVILVILQSVAVLQGNDVVPTPLYRQTISTEHAMNTPIVSLNQIVTTLYPELTVISTIQLTEFLYSNDTKTTKYSIGVQSVFMHCSAEPRTDDISGSFCFKDSTLELYVTKYYNPSPRKEIDIYFTFEVMGKANDNTERTLPFQVLVKIQSPCKAQENIYNEIHPPVLKELFIVKWHPISIEFGLKGTILKEQQNKKQIFLYNIQIEGFTVKRDVSVHISDNGNNIIVSKYTNTTSTAFNVFINRQSLPTETSYFVQFFDLLQKTYISIPSSIILKMFYYVSNDFCGGAERWNTYVRWKHVVDGMKDEECKMEDVNKFTELYQSCTENTKLSIIKSSSVNSYGNPVLLTCVTENLVLAHVYNWYYVKGDSERRLLNTTTSNTYSIPSLHYQDIGSYFCEASFDVMDAVKANDNASIILNDVYDGGLKFVLKDLVYTLAYALETSNEYKEMKKEMETKLAGILDNKDVDSPNQPEFNVVAFRNRTNNIHVIGSLYMRKTNGVTVHQVNFVEWIDNVINTIKTSQVFALTDLQLTTLQLCSATKVRSSNGLHTFDFEAKHVGETTFSKCPNDENQASIECIHSDQYYAEWTELNDSLCVYDMRGESLTARLKTLQTTNVTEKNAVTLSKDLMEYSLNISTNGTSYDASLFGMSVSNFLEQMSNETEVADNIFESINNFMESKDAIIGYSETTNNTATRVIKFLGDAAEKIISKRPVNVQKKNYAMLGLKVDRSSFKNTIIELKTLKDRNMNLDVITDESINENNAKLEIPKSILDSIPPTVKNIRLAAVAFKSSKLFQVKKKKSITGEDFDVNTNILSVEFRGHTMRNLTEPIIMKFNSLNKSLQPHDKKCAYWKFSNRSWSTEGCTLHSEDIENNLYTCHCDHLTNFAMLFNSVQPLSTVHRNILSIITNVGLSLSLIGASLTFIAHAIFPSLRESTPPKLLMNLCVSVIILSMLFLAGADNNDYSDTACSVIAGLIHYSFLTVLFWGGIEAFHSARGLVFPMKTEISKFLIKAMVIGWGVPIIFPLIGGLAMTDDYGLFSDEKSCVVHGNSFFLLQLTPSVIILVTNIVALCAIMYSLNASSMKYSANSLKLKDRFRIIIAFMILFGFTWLLGLLVINNDILIFQYLFCILSTLQGFYIFGFYCVRNQKIRKYARALLSGKRVLVNDDYSNSTLSQKRKHRCETMETTVSSLSTGNGNQYNTSSLEKKGSF